MKRSADGYNLHYRPGSCLDFISAESTEELEIPISNLLHVLELHKVQGELVDDIFRGNVYVFSDLTYYSRIAKNGLIICNRHEFGTGFMFSWNLSTL